MTVTAVTSPPVANMRPNVSLSTLARLMHEMSPKSIAALLRAHKQRAMGPRRSYQAARRQAIDLLVDGTPVDTNASVRTYEREAIRALQLCPPKLPQWARAVRPTENAAWLVEGIRVSMRPDVILDGRERGSAKFSFTKTPLPDDVGRSMATLLYHFDRVVRNDRSIKSSHCIVFEPRARRRYLPHRNPERALDSLRLTCALIRALWPMV